MLPNMLKDKRVVFTLASPSSLLITYVIMFHRAYIVDITTATATATAIVAFVRMEKHNDDQQR